jgi:hypothetical protein
MFQSLENRSLKSSNRWKFFAVLFPIIGTCAMAQGPGSQAGFFQAWWGASSGFSPNSIAGLEWWLDAADATTVSLQAGTNLVTQWDDKSGNARHAAQATSGSRPSWLENTQNGNPVIRFFGTRFLSVASSTAQFNYIHQSNTTIFIAFSQRSGATSSWNLWDNANRGASVGTTLITDNRRDRAFATNGIIFIAQGSGAVIDNRAANLWTTNDYHLLTIRNTPSATATNRSELSIDTGQVFKNNTSSGTISANNAAVNMVLGANQGGASAFDGDFCEIIIYSSALSDADVEQVKNYLNSKWSLY